MMVAPVVVCHAACDQLLLALSILIVKLTTLAFRNPRGNTTLPLKRKREYP